MYYLPTFVGVLGKAVLRRTVQKNLPENSRNFHPSVKFEVIHKIQTAYKEQKDITKFKQTASLTNAKEQDCPEVTFSMPNHQPNKCKILQKGVSLPPGLFVVVVFLIQEIF